MSCSPCGCQPLPGLPVLLHLSSLSFRSRHISRWPLLSQEEMNGQAQSLSAGTLSVSSAPGWRCASDGFRIHVGVRATATMCLLSV